jgi:two-component system response regulator
MNMPSVLLVEDNKDDQVLALWVLNKLGLNNVTVASDGLEALHLLHGNSGAGVDVSCKPDIIILDLRLPKLDGLDVLRRLRSDERTKDISVYALTSSEDPYDKQVCNELGVPAFFAKPLTEKAVLDLKLF